MGYGIAFDPLISTPLLIAAGIAAIAVALLLLVSRSRSAIIRGFAFAAAFLALANPSFTREDREPLTSVAADGDRSCPSDQEEAGKGLALGL